MILGRGAPQIHFKVHTCDRLRPPSNGFQVLKVHTFIIRWLLGLSLQGWHCGHVHRSHGIRGGVKRTARRAASTASTVQDLGEPFHIHLLDLLPEDLDATAGAHFDSEALSHGIDAKLQLALKSHGVRVTVRSDISDIGDIGDDDRVFSQI